MPTHMKTVLKETYGKLMKMERLDVEKAQETAKKQIMNHLQNKITQEELDLWINRAAELVGTDQSLLEEIEVEVVVFNNKSAPSGLFIVRFRKNCYYDIIRIWRLSSDLTDNGGNWVWSEPTSRQRTSLFC